MEADRQNPDDYDEYDDQYDEDDLKGTQRSQVVQNQPHDEEVNLSESESFAGGDDPPAVPQDASLIESHDMEDMPVGAPSAPMRSQSPEALSRIPGKTASPEAPTPPPSGYNAMDFKHLNVSEDIKELFKHIGRYKSNSIELDTKLKPFIPDYIPAVGGIDEFIKVPRPDGKPDFLGLKVLDEPAARQSDPTVLTLQLRNLSKEAPGSKADMVGRVEHGDDARAKKVASWVASMADIHKSKPPANVSYKNKMPEIEFLMQEWPPEMEAFLKNMRLPSGELDLDLKTYATLVCNVLDIPVYNSAIESLHVLFSLYLEFRNNPIFRSIGERPDQTMSSAYNPMGAQSMDGSNSMTENVNVMTFS